MKKIKEVKKNKTGDSYSGTNKSKLKKKKESEECHILRFREDNSIV